MTRANQERAPRHPGRILVEDFLSRIPTLTQAEVADGLGMSRPRLNELVNRVRGVSPDTALRLARGFGTTAEFWMSAQSDWDLHEARRSRKKMQEIERIQPWTAESIEPDGRSAPDARAAVGILVTTASDETVEHYEDFLARRGMLTEARRFVRARARMHKGEAELTQPQDIKEHTLVVPPPMPQEG